MCGGNRFFDVDEFLSKNARTVSTHHPFWTIIFIMNKEEERERKREKEREREKKKREREREIERER